MSESGWHFIRSDGAQVGPVEAQVIRDALRSGAATQESMVWRDGLAAWVPAREVAGELGLAEAQGRPAGDLSAPAPPLRPNPGPDPSDVVPAGFVRRWAALFLDQIILLIPISLIVLVLAVLLGIALPSGNEGQPDVRGVLAFEALFYGLYLFVAACYYAGLESSAKQSTFGKRALGIKVTDMAGRRISFGNALGRWFAAGLSYMVFYVGFIMAAFTDRKRALHDYVAGTQVVDQWAYTPFPERQQRGLSGCLLAFLIAMVAIPFVFGVFGAIAVSQYQDYVIRSQVSEGPALADGMKVAVAEYMTGNGSFPANNEAAGLPSGDQIQGAYVSRVDVEPTGAIKATFSSRSPQHANQALDRATLEFVGTVTGGSIVWTCRSSNLRQKFCPSTCSCQ